MYKENTSVNVDDSCDKYCIVSMTISKSYNYARVKHIKAHMTHLQLTFVSSNSHFRIDLSFVNFSLTFFRIGELRPICPWLLYDICRK